MPKTPLFVPLLLALAFTVPAGAEACVPTTSDPLVDVAGAVYVDGDRMCCSEVDALWVYAESNGIPGLQRQDDFVDDTCGGRIPSDTLVF